MAQVAIIKAGKDHEVSIVELRDSFSDYSSACQYLARCTCDDWQLVHVLLRPLVAEASRHAAEHTAPATTGEQ